MKARFAFLVAGILVAGLAACGSGGGNTPPTPRPSPTITPTPPLSTTITLGAAPTTAPIPGNISGTIAVPAGSGTLTVTASASAPPPAPVIMLAHKPVRIDAGGNTAVEYFTATATGGAVVLNGLPGFTATLPPGAPSGVYFVAYFNGTAWQSTTQTGGTPASGVVTVPATTTPTISLPTGTSLLLAVYVGGYIPPANTSGCVGVNLVRPSTGSVGRSLVGVHPINNGDAYNFSGSLVQTITRIEPCVQPPAIANANVTIQTTVNNGVENSVETDAYTTNTATLTTAANVKLSGNQYLETSETATDGNGNTIATQYAAPGLQYAQLLEGSGNWSNNPPSTVNQTIADGTTIARIYGAAGTYQETQTIPGGLGTNVITVNPDASGTYAIGQGTSNAVTIKLSAPVNGTITVTLGTSSLPIPSWLPSPTKLYSDVTTDLGPASLPGACTFTAGSGTPEHIQRVLQIVDPVLGYIETEIVDSYDIVGYFNGTTNVTLGPVCSSIADSLNEYYDYSVTTPFAFYFSLDAKPVITNTIAEQISLQASGLVADRTGRLATQNVRAQIAARLAGIAFTRAMQRSAQMHAMMHILGHTRGGLR